METVSVFIHELKNPLSNIYVLTQLLEKEESLDEIRKSIALIKTSIEHIKSIEKDFNLYCKTGMSSISRKTINVRDTLLKIIEEYKPIAESNDITIDYSLKTCRAYTDLDKFHHVISNLLSNAIKYRKSGKKGTIIIGCESVGNCVYINIKDSGIGMSDDELKLIGTEFYRCKRIEADGTGLGLSLVKKIVKLLNWELTINSKLNKGTEVILYVK